MIDKFNFELQLEYIAEKFYLNNAQSMNMPRGGNSSGNEIYFGSIANDLREKLDCQQILLAKGKCPDSGIFGDFNYTASNNVAWENIKSGKSVAIEITGVNYQKRYIEIDSSFVESFGTIQPKSKIELVLNDLDIYGEFFGIEYKAGKNKSKSSIAVAPFNSTCPCQWKSETLSKIKLIHNLKTTCKKKFEDDNSLYEFPIKLTIKFSMYYFIVNDVVEESKSIITKIFICDGGYFAPNTSQEEAKRLSGEIKPPDIGLKTSLHKVKLRFRPFFDARSIKAKGFGLYTSWEPKIAGEMRVTKARKELADLIETIPQENFLDEETANESGIKPEDNVIYLYMTEEMIKNAA